MSANTVDAMQAVQWYKEGWKVFMSNPVNWVLTALLFGVVAFVLGIIPLLGPIALNLIVPVLLGGMLVMAQTGKVEVMNLFSLFKQEKKRNQLLLLGALMLGASVIVAFVSGIFMGSALEMDPVTGMPNFSLGLGGILFILVVAVIMGMLFLYATPLIVFRDMSAVDAVKGSLNGASANILPFILFMVIYMILAMIASIPFMLGFLVLIPGMVGAIYAGYKDIFA